MHNYAHLCIFIYNYVHLCNYVQLCNYEEGLNSIKYLYKNIFPCMIYFIILVILYI